ncbi:FecR family protein [Mucilaginibacter sp. UR6-11]|uniref:FecR family protein n=1 Tax=Mucilaginibacter sp. UR6-11 TaxID=1435644 RepID=UPI001E4A6963|nr:FecR family protein [Mucilaginibacter sp. UR6-11]MCC8424576.1 DUF4974 domain-containing protein [Mucilaginibacter sp. UR6-11]
MENHDHLIPIFKKYLDNQCSPAEVAELLDFFRLRSDNDTLRALILEQLDKSVDIAAGEGPVDDAVFDRVFTAISKEIDQQEHAVPVVNMRRYYWAGVAASLLIASIIGLYVYKNKQAGYYTAKVKPYHYDALPGGNKARLTLADGEVIALDNAKNGWAAKQKNGTVTKAKDGELTYESGTGRPTEIPEFNTITTPRGGQYMVILPDGSKVWLNAASSLKFPVAFTGAERKVELTGEAYFEIFKNKQKPFKLTVNGAVVEVLGTHFNVMAYNDESALRTTLLEGSVKISKNDRNGLLKPGQQAEIDKQNVIRITEADTEQAMAWKKGYFKFNRDNIQTIMRQLSRWYDIDVVYEGKIPDDEFVGKIRRSVNVSEVLRVLELNNIHFKITDKKIIVTNIN